MEKEKEIVVQSKPVVGWAKAETEEHRVAFPHWATLRCCSFSLHPGGK